LKYQVLYAKRNYLLLISMRKLFLSVLKRVNKARSSESLLRIMAQQTLKLILHLLNKVLLFNVQSPLMISLLS